MSSSEIRHLHDGPAAEEALGPSYYDRVYSVSRSYRGKSEKAGHFGLWKRVAALVSPEDMVLEIGCGCGQLALMLYDKGIEYYRGFDFSEVGLGLCRVRVPSYQFTRADARDPEPFEDDDYEVAIAVEIFEHLDDDLAVIRQLPQGTRLIFSVPTFSSPSHVRFFRKNKAVHQYYGRALKNLQVEGFKQWFIGTGIV